MLSQRSYFSRHSLRFGVWLLHYVSRPRLFPIGVGHIFSVRLTVHNHAWQEISRLGPLDCLVLYTTRWRREEPANLDRCCEFHWYGGYR